MRFITDNFDTISTSEEQIKQLKQLVLNLAVTGRLVRSGIRERTAAEIVEDLKKEKAFLVSKKLMKKERPTATIEIDEIYFEIPGNWEWCRLNDLCSYIQRGKSPKYIDRSEVPIISQKCVQWTGFEIEKARFLDPKVLEKYSPERFVQSGDLLWNSTGHGTLGRIGVYYEKFNPYEKIVADSHVTVIRSFQEYVVPEYLFLWFASPFVQDEINDKSSGSTKQIELNTSTVKNYLVPLPPTEEQHRIVQKVNTLFQQIDQLAEQSGRAEATRQQLRVALLHRLEQAPGRAATATAWQPLAEQFDLAIRTRDDVQALRQTILQLAVRGALVPQNPGDESAGELLKRIKIEKERLVKAGEIRKEKGLSAVRKEDVPFEVPAGWVWCRLGDIAITRSGVTKGKKYKTALFSVPYLRVANVQRGYLDLDQVKEISVSENDIQKYQLEIGDLLMTEGGDADKLGRCAIWNNEIEGCIHQNHIFCVRSLDKTKILSQYIELFANSKTCREYFEGCAKQTTNLASINMTVLKNTPIALPPSLEQHCIVQKVEALLGWCDALEAGLEEMKQVEARLVRAAMKVG